MKSLNKFILAVVLCAAAKGASATVISVNGASVEALDLNGSYTSFEDFYGFNTGVRFSSNTGLEVADRIVMFFAELDNELAFYTLVSGSGGKSGAASLAISGTQGGISFVDDANERVSASEVIWQYNNNRGDGLIYSGLAASGGWQLSMMFSDLIRNEGLDLLSFSGGQLSGQNLAISGVETEFEARATTIPEPAGLTLFMSMCCAMVVLRRKQFTR